MNPTHRTKTPRVFVNQSVTWAKAALESEQTKSRQRSADEGRGCSAEATGSWFATQSQDLLVDTTGLFDLLEARGRLES